MARLRSELAWAAVPPACPELVLPDVELVAAAALALLVALVDAAEDEVAVAA